jgi:NAD(P)H-dependent FMN reductase
LERTYSEYAAGEAPAGLDELATLYRRADGFIIVSGEYNHGIPPALKNLLDYFLEEYFWRPSGIVCYSSGQFGGVRAAMQLRMVLGELGMPSIPTLLAIPRIGGALEAAGRPQQEWLGSALTDFLAEFAWYARALKQGRAGGTPY